jgi:hypothetical protein
MELPDSLFRETKALAARKGSSLRQVVVEALAQQLKAEKEMPAAKPWLRAFRDLRRDDDLVRELRRLSRRVDAAFERVNEEDWR